MSDCMDWYALKYLMPGSKWQPSSGWSPSDAIVEITEVVPGRVYFKRVKEESITDELDLSFDNFTDAYDPVPVRHVDAPSLF